MAIKERDQIAALPVIIAPDGKLRVMVVTSRDTGRWIIPKGWTIKGKAGWEAAAVEAFEEAGVEGRIARDPLGYFSYDKVLDDGKIAPCRVAVFRLDVTRWVANWPESDERDRLWCSPLEAADRLQEPELKDILRKLARQAAKAEKKAAAGA